VGSGANRAARSSASSGVSARTARAWASVRVRPCRRATSAAVRASSGIVGPCGGAGARTGGHVSRPGRWSTVAWRTWTPCRIRPLPAVASSAPFRAPASAPPVLGWTSAEPHPRQPIGRGWVEIEEGAGGLSERAGVRVVAAVEVPGDVGELAGEPVTFGHRPSSSTSRRHAAWSSAGSSRRRRPSEVGRLRYRSRVRPCRSAARRSRRRAFLLRGASATVRLLPVGCCPPAPARPAEGHAGGEVGSDERPVGVVGAVAPAGAPLPDRCPGRRRAAATSSQTPARAVRYQAWRITRRPPAGRGGGRRSLGRGPGRLAR
jgi:hypothetical protein